MPFKVSTLRKRESLVRKILLGDAFVKVCISSYEDAEFLRREGLLDKVEIYTIENIKPELVSNFPDPRLRVFAAQKARDPELLRRLANDTDEVVRVAAVINKHTPPEVMEEKCKDPSQKVRYWAVRLAPKFPSEAVTDSSAQVRTALCSRNDCPPEVLKRLADDKASTVRACVAQNPNTPPEVLDYLAKSSDLLVVLKVASRDDIPESILQDLLRRGGIVREIAKDTLRRRKRKARQNHS